MDKVKLLNFVKNYIKIDYNADDELLYTIIEASKDYIKDTIGYFDIENNRMLLLICALSTDLYSKRSFVINKEQAANPAIRSIIAQLSNK